LEQVHGERNEAEFSFGRELWKIGEFLCESSKLYSFRVLEVP